MPTGADPLISIALCTYNGERFLREQLDSLLALEYAPLEVVALDDASSDATPSILAEYAARDPRIRVFRNPENLGHRRSFERAMQLCEGDLIAPSDQDDVWLPSKLRRLVDALGDADAAYCDSELVDVQGRSLGQLLSQLLPRGPIHDPSGFALGNVVSGHALLFRRALLAKALPVPEVMFHDWWIALVAADGKGVAWCPEPLVRYRQHSASVTDIAGLKRRGEDRRPRGRSLAGYEAQERQLQACAAYLGDRCEVIARAARLFTGRRDRFLCPALAWHFLANRNRLYAFQPSPPLVRLRKAAKLFWGLRLKQLIQPHDYTY